MYPRKFVISYSSAPCYCHRRHRRRDQRMARRAVNGQLFALSLEAALHTNISTKLFIYLVLHLSIHLSIRSPVCHKCAPLLVYASIRLFIHVQMLEELSWWLEIRLRHDNYIVWNSRSFEERQSVWGIQILMCTHIIQVQILIQLQLHSQIRIQRQVNLSVYLHIHVCIHPSTYLSICAFLETKFQ